MGEGMLHGCASEWEIGIQVGSGRWESGPRRQCRAALSRRSNCLVACCVLPGKTRWSTWLGYSVERWRAWLIPDRLTVSLSRLTVNILAVKRQYLFDSLSRNLDIVDTAFICKYTLCSWNTLDKSIYEKGNTSLSLTNRLLQSIPYELGHFCSWQGIYSGDSYFHNIESFRMLMWMK